MWGWVCVCGVVCVGVWACGCVCGGRGLWVLRAVGMLGCGVWGVGGRCARLSSFPPPSLAPASPSQAYLTSVVAVELLLCIHAIYTFQALWASHDASAKDKDKDLPPGAEDACWTVFMYFVAQVQ